MISDGQVGQSIMYNDLDLIGKITKNGTALVNYSYLVDGTKLSALKDSGEGLVYRGPFVYRKSAAPGNSSLTLESASFGGGRLTSNGAMLYVTDYLGSVRAVVDGQSGELYKASDYSAFGEENDVDSSKIDLGNFSISDLDGQISAYYNTCTIVPVARNSFKIPESGLVYGNILVTNIGEGYVVLGNPESRYLDTYDFDIKGENIFRDLFTSLGDWYNGSGIKYNIYTYGKKKVSNN